MLRVEALHAFYGDAQALWGVDLEVGEGEIVGLVGPNGAGKSTLVNVIAGLHRQVRGSVTIAGSSLTTVPPHRVGALGVALVPEGRRIFPQLSVQDNLDLGAYRRAARDEHERSLEWVHSLFPRLEARGAQLAGTLSGGEQQMLAIGRALMARPRLLLMDEPSLGLAPVIVDEVFDVVQTINAEGVSVLLVEQNVARALEISARSYLLSEGRIVLAGPSAELVESDEVRRTVLGV
jgi:branched-chain amino acid transport system ATP-binding protein